MTLPRHKEYKDTPNQWLGKIPSHWRSTKLGYLTSKIGSGKTPLGGADVYTSSGILFVRSQNVYDEGLALDDVVYIRAETDAEMSWSRVAPGDILLNITGASLGRTCLVPDEFGAANVNQHVCIIRLSQEELRPYIALVMKSAAIKAQIDATQNGAAREGLNFEQISKLALAIPPLPEQSAIAAFLGRETGKIDALVAEQEKLITLLKEKRQAVISHAVTKGLDPAASMKDSGIEWLGEVPAHWDVCHIKRMCNTITDGAHISPETEAGVYPFVSTKDVAENFIDFNNCLLTSESNFNYLVQTGCRPIIGYVLFSKDGTVGRTAIVRQSLDFVVASSLIIIRPNQSWLVSDFLNYLCRSSVANGQVESFVKGAGLPRLSIQNLLKVIGVFPSIREQEVISAFLDRETAKLETLIVETQRAINLLKERRTALISAAVTGKIDVRGLVDMREAA
jgi:type I restriction enzyme, S subunit